jgi:hypothetical protein
MRSSYRVVKRTDKQHPEAITKKLPLLALTRAKEKKTNGLARFYKWFDRGAVCALARRNKGENEVGQGQMPLPNFALMYAPISSCGGSCAVFFYVCESLFCDAFFSFHRA